MQTGQWVVRARVRMMGTRQRAGGALGGRHLAKPSAQSSLKHPLVRQYSIVNTFSKRCIYCMCFPHMHFMIKHIPLYIWHLLTLTAWLYMNGRYTNIPSIPYVLWHRVPLSWFSQGLETWKRFWIKSESFKALKSAWISSLVWKSLESWKM